MSVFVSIYYAACDAEAHVPLPGPLCGGAAHMVCRVQSCREVLKALNVDVGERVLFVFLVALRLNLLYYYEL
jgi:hypothetical protein